MIDTHCHLTAPEFAVDREIVLARAQQQGVDPIITIADSMEDSHEVVAFAQRYPSHVYCTVGVHPHHASSWRDSDAETLRSLAQHTEVVAIGEIGLDYHYDLAPRDVQRTVCETQLSLARDLKLPSVIHCREALPDLLEIIKGVRPPKLVLHCCTERISDVAELVASGHMLSFTGIATYPKAEAVRETIRQCPLGQILLETDAPYLAPVPYRGKRNEPAFLPHIAQCIAGVKGISLEEVERTTTENAVRFFEL